MPIRIQWKNKEFIGLALMLLGSCGLFQILFIFIAQYFLRVGNYLAIIIIPIGVTVALFFASKITLESFAQVERRKKLRSQFSKTKGISSKIKIFVKFPVIRPLLILFAIFAGFYFISYVICIIFFDPILSFIIAENLATFICLLISNYIEKNYARVTRY